MKIYTHERYSGSDIRELTSFADAVQHVCDRATVLCSTELECVKARQDALQGIIGTMLRKLYNDGVLSADQIQTILDDRVTIVEK